MFKNILILLILSISLNAKDLVCLRKVTHNIDTGQIYKFTLKEAKSSPFIINKQGNDIYLKLHSGTKYKYKYYKKTSDFTHFHSSESNTNLRHMFKKPSQWFLDINSNNQMLSILLICGG